MDIKKQITINSIGAFVNLFAQWVISVALVRMGGFADAGIFSLVMSISNVFGAVANFGIRSYQISDAGGRFSQKQYLLARIGAIVLSFVLCGAYLLLDTGYSAVGRWGIVLYLIYTATNYFSDVLFGTLQLKDKLYLNGYSSILKGVLCAAFFLGSYAVRKDLLLSLVCMEAANILMVAVYDLPNYRREEQGPFWQRGSWTAARKILVLCFPLLLSAILPLITTAVPRRSIESILGEEALGYFSSLFTPTVVITTLVPTVVTGVMPGIANAWQTRDRRTFFRQVSGCFGGVTAFTLFAALCAFVAGRPVMRLLFGSEILSYFDLLYLAILASGMCALRGCCTSILICMRRSKAVMVTSAAETLTTMALSNLLVTQRQIEGAALTLMAAYGASLLIQVLCILAPCGAHFKNTTGDHGFHGE